MRKIKLVSIVMILGSTAASGNPFYQDKERGWFWHELPPKEEELVKEPPSPNNQNTPKEKVELNSEWIKENLPKLLNRAMDNPTNENLAAYAYAQRLAMDTASRFSSRMTDFQLMETALDESNRRPTSGFALNEFNAERSKVISEAVNSVKNSSKGIFFFYASDCGFCHRLIPVMQELQRRHGLEILGISMDGGVIPGMEGMEIVYDQNNEVSEIFNVNVTPTLHLVLPDNSNELIVVGLKTVSEIEDRLLFAARKSGILSEEMYAKTRGVRELNVFRNEEGVLLADKKLLENEPGYLAELLKMQLENNEVQGTRRVRRN